MTFQTLRLTIASALLATSATAATGIYEVMNHGNGIFTGINALGGSTGTIAGVGGYDMAIEATGNFIVASGGLFRVTPAGVTTTIANPPAGGGFLSVAVDAAGNFICADNETHRVFRVSSNGASVVPVATYPTTLSQLEDVVVRVDSSGNYIVAHDNNGVHLVVITPSGVVTPITLTGATPLGAGGFTFDAHGNYIMADYAGNALYTITPAGVVTLLTSSSLSKPIGITRDPSTGNYIVANAGNNSVVAIGPTGSPVTTLLSGSTLSAPWSVVLTNPAGAGPNVSQVLNNYGLIPAGFPNSGIAPGSLMILKGVGLADPSAPAVLQSSVNALPGTLNGASVKVTVNGITTNPVFYYAIASQLALVLPSNTPTGTAQVTVTYNGQTSPPVFFPVVQSNMGFDAYYGAGVGLGVATNNATGALYNYANSIPPGTTVVLWGSGLGADAARDTTYTPAAFAINNLAHIYVGGLDAGIVYQGASGYPGVNQVDVTIPAGVQPGCNVSVVGVTAAGTPTNFISLPIGNGPCADAAFGASGAQLQSLSAQSAVKTGVLSLSELTSPASAGGTQVTETAGGVFQSNAGSIFGTAGGIVSLGGCVVTQSNSAFPAGVTSTPLNPGTLTVASSSSTATLAPGSQIGGYLAALPAGFIPASGGTFTFHATGSSVGSFDAAALFPSGAFTWTNQVGTVTRASGVTVSWTGAAAGTFVTISGTSTSTASGPSVSGSFSCSVPATPGQFTIPGYVLGALPGGTGTLAVTNYADFQTFLASGIDNGMITTSIGASLNVVYN